MLLPSFILASLAAVAVAQSASPTTPSSPSGTVEPCAVVSSLLDDSSIIPAEYAYACLTSVPVDVPGNSELIDELKFLWQWQSEVGWLKNTPSTWELGPIDLIGELDKIKAKLSSYTSEYQLQLDIWQLTIRTGNFHFNYMPDILQVFSFSRQLGIASISSDGKSFPKVYVINDIFLQQAFKTNISDIVQINGQDTQSFLLELTTGAQYIDIDARYNTFFYKANQSASFGSFVNQNGYDGPSTNLTFANGTTHNYVNVASANQNFTGITSGSDFFQAFCQGSISGFQQQGSPTKKSINLPIHKRQTIPSTYPTPIVEHSGGAVAGYFMTNPGFQDVAVLKIITFEPAGDDSGSEFQSVVQQFLGNCTLAKKTKLIIDLRENGGGATNLLLDTFMQLFPTMLPFSAQRYRAQEQYKLIGDSVNQIYNNATLSSLYTQVAGGDIGSNNGNDAYRYWAYWHFVDVNNKNFPSWNSFYGPHTYNNDNFTTTMRYNLSNADRVSVVVPGFNFLPQTGPQPFPTSNIVMFTDGMCGSSCASFAEELKNIAGVRSVVVGGRPRSAPMQAIGGTKGGEVVPLNTFVSGAAQLINVTDTIGAKSLHGTAIEKLAGLTQVMLRVGDQRSRLQTQDQIRKGDVTETPLQYIYEAADCRIWNTAPMLLDPSEAWKAAWSAFSDKTLCANGSTGDKSSISGGYKPFGPGPLNGLMNQTNATTVPTPSSTVLTVPTAGAAVWGPHTLFLVATVLAAFAML
ncbi:hypothetical protein K432DRAFT_350154 [Lepidopterella palustris CBS 459.81]|uniref:Tail specific protease domain-containing protein n=1 Tax=Lepidopterella palustris CBS 459.81 TaxID=1314670 RepID=A0A8E2EDB4_9PEZI|nr:hypothetical protein K432DRAFT_350154 [Lepidopterella palustris CBS 459.81]